MLRWSIASVCMGGALEEKLAAAAKAGFRAVEIFENDLTFFRGKPRDARLMAADLGLELVALQPLRDFEAMPDPASSEEFRPGGEKARPHARAWRAPALPMLKCLARRDRRSRARRPRPRRTGRSRPPARHADRLRGARLGAVGEGLDRGLGHRARRRSRQPRDCARQLSHLRPRQSDRADRRPAGREDRPRAGGRCAGAHHGPAVAEPALSLLSRPGRLSDRRLSRRRDPLRLSRPAVARNLQRPVSRRLGRRDRDRRHALAARRRRSAGGEARRARRPAARRPAAASAAAGGRAGRIHRVCGGRRGGERIDRADRGPRIPRAGRHRSKDVDLYSQGEINFIVNREREGFAHSFSLLHGPSVCAIALCVDSVDKALERASALECQTYVGKIGPGEATVPAAAGVEGSLIYFIGAGDPAWRDDFALGRAACRRGRVSARSIISPTSCAAANS